ncbi:probable leucine-rich repeat receptor-like serine/threonine-protein kinase At3g14840 isoform X2 [Magnolia sinica]|uniref:probable leucine-rich repeat receptor-like serine/threonine-protein kinase At3g14840 isoform X2 n=1 Tax=Magnolia sinica TaxID=86752 RepID=UPI00265AF8E5|nr:probable leucine-rich repeat receptor-like serine/threonine-protein kinase At3g14840 isoform X2 [Magnolia sinica]
MFSDRMICGSRSHLFNSNIYFSSFILFLILALSFLAKVPSAVAQLDPAEVEILGQIANTLGKHYREDNIYPCSQISGWTPNATLKLENNVTCDCSFANNTTCHVVSIVLKAQDLQGVLPPELTKLPHLKEIDLSHNFLSGTIPPGWGSMSLEIIALLGNRLSGPIPTGLGKSVTLKQLVLEANHFKGTLPEEIGNIVTLERFLISSNEFTGQLPGTLAKLTNLTDFRISDNKFTGKIPNFIQNWTKLTKVAIQASGLEGPVPSEIFLLEKMTDMRISDINGTEWRFPPESRMKEMKTLILRNCNLSGPIHPYIGNMTSLKTLDLSYNKLSGPIPPTFDNLAKTQFMYLTSNLLTGDVPDWMLKKGKNIDLSYNNFTVGGLAPRECLQRNVNLFGTSSMLNNSSGVVPCLKNFACPKRGRFSLHINCGGTQATNGSITYAADQDNGGPSNFFTSYSDYWAFSSTGNFLDDDDDRDNYKASNISALSFPNSALYTTARLSPLSLTYYGLCLINENYTVNLHFAEIKFTAGNNYGSLGKRIFDVYIQGKLVLKDFNIEDAAGGPNKPTVRSFPAVVTTNTLEIRFYWAGKGTTCIPERGIYGPLISAISVNPNFVPPSEGGKKISAGAVAGIIISALFLTFLILGILWWKGCLRQKDTMDQELRGLDLQTGSFTLRQIKAATNNFDPANKIGEGGFGPVYKGLLSDGTIIAVKQLSSKSKQGNREFVNEIGMISALQHPHLVKLYGCCIEGNQLLLIYEYMENNSLARALFECQLNLDWPTRHKICVGIARGLAYLHEESRLKIVHRDIKGTNVLLDKDLNPKISDFGLAKLDEEENTHISTRIAGTLGYMAPEYAMRGYLTDKADVYSFGVVALEIVSGKSNISYKAKEECVYLLDWAYVLQERGKLMELVDPKLGTDFNMEEAMTMLNVAILCTNSSAVCRPTMSAVVSMLEGRTIAQDLISDPNVSEDDMMFKAIRSKQQHEIHSQSDSQSQSLLMDGPWTGSATSAPDLYPINLDSQYWKDRE